MRSIHLHYRLETLTNGVPSVPGDASVTGAHRPTVAAHRCLDIDNIEAQPILIYDSVLAFVTGLQMVCPPWRDSFLLLAVYPHLAFLISAIVTWERDHVQLASHLL